MKVVLILLDGMRPDCLDRVPKAKELMEKSVYTLDAKTVFPSVTLPCHVSLFHSVPPERHGTVTNVYTPQVRPVTGLFELLSKNKKKCAMFYDWEELRDLGRPGSLRYSVYRWLKDGEEDSGTLSTDDAINCLKSGKIDFCFLYLGLPDGYGHGHGWMTDKYIEGLRVQWENVARVIDELGDDYHYIITSDHGGHERSHGSDMPEDMLIPVFALGEKLKDAKLENVNIMDIAPTIAKLFDIEPDSDWEGKSFI